MVFFLCDTDYVSARILFSWLETRAGAAVTLLLDGRWPTDKKAATMRARSQWKRIDRPALSPSRSPLPPRQGRSKSAAIIQKYMNQRTSLFFAVEKKGIAARNWGRVHRRCGISSTHCFAKQSSYVKRSGRLLKVNWRAPAAVHPLPGGIFLVALSERAVLRGRGMVISRLKLQCASRKKGTHGSEESERMWTPQRKSLELC